MNKYHNLLTKIFLNFIVPFPMIKNKMKIHKKAIQAQSIKKLRNNRESTLYYSI